MTFFDELEGILSWPQITIVRFDNSDCRDRLQRAYNVRGRVKPATGPLQVGLHPGEFMHHTPSPTNAKSPRQAKDRCWQPADIPVFDHGNVVAEDNRVPCRSTFWTLRLPSSIQAKYGPSRPLTLGLLTPQTLP